MKRLKVVIPPIVQDQIREQVLYIARDSIDKALAWEDRLRSTIRGIGDLAADVIDEEATARISETIRRCVFEGTYLIHYRVNKSGRLVEIVNFRHGARSPRRGEP